MAEFCIPRQLAEKLKAAARNKEINVNDLFTMTSKERHALFGKYVDDATAQQINARFESALLKKTVAAQKNALKKWAESVFSSSEKAQPKYKTVIDKINELDKLGVLTPANESNFYYDLVAEKLGATVQPNEAKKIVELSKKLEEAAKNTSEFNTPTLEYFEAKKQMDDYLDSLTPASQVKVLTSTAFRGAMLFNVRSPLLNIESNTIQGVLQIAERRIASRRLFGLNNDYALKYMRYVNKVYSKTGYDLSRFEAQGGERKVLGEDYLHSQGKGVIRAIGRFYEDVVFKKTQGLPDVVFSSAHFADSANLQSSILAKSMKLKGKAAKERALAIFKDATSLNPQTKEGLQVRAQAQADALMATYTNDTLYSDVSLGIRKVFNIASGDLRAGDQIMSFVKTPANVLGAGLDQSGITVPVRVLYGMGKTFRDIRSGVPFDEARKANFKGTYRSMVRAGLGLTFAYLLSQLFKPEDFVGVYPTSKAERELLTLRNAPTNAVKIGGTWISLDFLGPLGAPFIGMMYARKYGKGGWADWTYKYMLGAATTLQNLPGLKEFSNAVSDIQKNAPTDKTTLDEAVQAFTKSAAGYLQSRIIPSFVNDIAKITDPYDRSIDKNDALAQAKKQLPGVRKELPIKKNIYAEPVKNESALSTLLFGSRVKTAQDDAITRELVRLDKAGELPAITDVSQTSTRAKNLRKQIGETKFAQAMQYFGTNLKEAFGDTLNDYAYQSMTDQEKHAELNRIKEEVFTDMLYEYGYEFN